jgi:hypothetical protein
MDYEYKKIYEDYCKIVKTNNNQDYNGAENEGKRILQYSLWKSPNEIEYSEYSNSNLKNGYTVH